jgi:hypothetical protein
LIRGFGFGGLYLAFLSVFIAELTGASYGVSLATVSATAITLFALSLVLAARWALRPSLRGCQLELGSLFLLTAILAVYLAAIRGLLAAAAVPMERLNLGAWIGILMGSFCLLLFSAPFILVLGDSLLSLAAWLVWRPAVQRWLRRLRQRS